MLAAEFAGILGKAEDSIKYAKLAQTIKECYCQQISMFQIPAGLIMPHKVPRYLHCGMIFPLKKIAQ